MRTDTVEEPTVVTDDHGTSGKVFQTFFESTERVHINVVGGFVQQQHITFFLQAERQMQTLRSPPESTPQSFSWSAPEKLKRDR